MEKCNSSTVPGNKKPPIGAQPLDKEQHSMFRTAVGQLLWVSQLRVDISFAGRNSLLRYIEGTTHCRVSLAPKIEHNEQREIKVDIESFADSYWAGCNTTRKSTSGTNTTCWGSPLLHISQTQSTIALSSAEVELYAMGQATIEAQHIKQVIQEMTIPNMIKNIYMSINTDSSAVKAVASRLGLNKKTKHVHFKYLYMQDIVQRGEMTITKIPTTHNPADVWTKHFPAPTINSHLDRLCLQAQLPTTVNALHGLPTSKRMTIGMI
eukprot:215268-Amphidinium_carterae.1